MQQVRSRAYLAVQLLNCFLNLFSLSGELGGIAPSLLSKLREANAKHGQCLTGAVVQLASDMPAFFILTSQQAPGELSNLVGLLLQFSGASPHLCIKCLGQLAEVFLCLFASSHIAGCTEPLQDLAVYIE